MDLLFYNGIVEPIVGERVRAVGVTDGKISFLGDDAAGLALADVATKKVDLAGRLLLPGLIDTHMHISMLGEWLSSINLGETRSRAELITMGQDYLKAHPDTKWFYAAGWNNDFWDEPSFPTRHDLDRISTEIPVVFSRVCGHVISVNSKALEVAGIRADTPNPAGGEYDRDETGEPTGILKETAGDVMMGFAPKPTVEDYETYIKIGSAAAVSCGLTTVHSDDITDYWVDDPAIAAYKRLIARGELPLRVVQQCRLVDMAHLEHFLKQGLTFGSGDEHFRIGPLKLIGDGSLGARTAYLSRPYSDEPSTRGVPCYTQEEFDALIGLAAAHDMPCAIHSIGDATTDRILNTIEGLRKTETKHLRHGIVHLQITRPDQLQRVKELDVMALTQPIFLDYDSHIADSRVGDFAKSSYAFKTLFDLGVHQSFGSDCPVEFCDVRKGLRCAVTRCDHDNLPAGGWYPEERVSMREAVKGFTIYAAYASGEEDVKGSIELGKYADFTVIDRDIFAIDPFTVNEARIEMTIVGGRVVYEA